MQPESYAEFVDPYPEVYTRKTPDQLLMPWTQTHPDAILVPVDFLRMAAKDENILKIQRFEQEYTGSLAAQIVNHGLMEPGTLKVDSSLRYFLKDGNHRLVCFMALGYPSMPVLVKVQESIKGHAVNLGDTPDLLFRLFNPGRYGVVGYG